MKKWIILNVYLPVGGAILLGVLFGIYIPTQTNKEKGNLITTDSITDSPCLAKWIKDNKGKIYDIQYVVTSKGRYDANYGRSNQVSKTTGDFVTYYDVKDPALLKPYIQYEVLNRTKGSFKINVDGKDIELHPSGFSPVKKIGVVTVIPSENFDGVISLTIKK